MNWSQALPPGSIAGSPMARYVLSPQAHEDLREPRDYIAQDNPTAARRVLNSI